MMNANRLFSGGAPFGQAHFAGSSRTFSTFKPIPSTEGCTNQQGSMFFAPEYMYPSSKPTYYVNFSPNFASKQKQKEVAHQHCMEPVAIAVLAISELKIDDYKNCGKSKVEKGDLCVSEAQPNKRQHCSSKKKKCNLKKKWKKRWGCGSKKSSRHDPPQVIVPVRNVSECGSEDTFIIEFQCSGSGVNDSSLVKKVRFADNEHLCKVHMMNKWDFAYRAARKGPWEEMARDRDRFRKRIREAELQLSPVLRVQHRDRIYQERFAFD